MLVSRFWLIFAIVFGVICVIPVWPSKSGSLLPFATPYVNFGFQVSDLILFAFHVAVTTVLATVVYSGWKFFGRSHP